MTIFWCIFSGFLSGIFGGMGMGGGTLLIPILSIFLGFEQKLCQGINLMSFLLMALVSIYIHRKSNLIVLKGVFWIIIPGVVFSVFGAFLMSFFSTNILKICFGCFLIVLAISDFFKVFKKLFTKIFIYDIIYIVK